MEASPHMETEDSKAQIAHWEMIISPDLSRSFDSDKTSLVLRTSVSEQCSASGFKASVASFDLGAILHYHAHEFRETSRVLDGLQIQGRDCLLKPLGCVRRVLN